jgi:FG-GAP repeat
LEGTVRKPLKLYSFATRINIGYSVAVSGNTIAVGDPYWGSLPEGAVYVFLKPPTGWSTVNETAKLTASDGGVNGNLNLGSSVAIGGNAVAAGAPTWYNAAIRNTDRKTVNALLSLLSLPGYVRIGPGRSFSILNIEGLKS